MALTKDQILAAALLLAPSDREALAEELLAERLSRRSRGDRPPPGAPTSATGMPPVVRPDAHQARCRSARQTQPQPDSWKR